MLAPNVKSDKQKVRQILLNLISNAIKYTKKGSVLVDARKSSGGDTVLMEVSQDNLAMEVRVRSVVTRNMPLLYSDKNRTFAVTCYMCIAQEH